MTKMEFSKAMKRLSSFYSRNLEEEDLIEWYGMFSNVGYEIFNNAITEVVKANKFFPTVAELISECDRQKENRKIKILELMKANGYFKNEFEYEKTMYFMSKGILPSWIKEEMKKYINSNNQIINNPVGLIEG